jgi:hypothetical protein
MTCSLQKSERTHWFLDYMFIILVMSFMARTRLAAHCFADYEIATMPSDKCKYGGSYVRDAVVKQSVPHTAVREGKVKRGGMAGNFLSATTRK